MLPEYYTVTEAAKLMGIHERNVRELIRIGQLKTVTVGDKEKVTKESIDELPAGFKDDPNPDVQPKRQFHPNIQNDVSREFAKRRGTYINQNPSSY